MPYDTSLGSFFEGRFSDGKTAGARDVRVALSSRGLVIRFERAGEELVWPFDALQTSEPLSHHAIDALVSNTQQPGASLFVPHGQFARSLAKAAPKLTTRDARRRAAVPWLWAAAAVVGVFVAISLTDLSPTRTVARMMPQTLRASLGEHTIRSITNNRAVCDSPYGSAALKAMTERLADGLQDKPDFKVIVVDWDMVNAFATPGDRIVVTSGLLEAAQSADEVAGVLAHEMGHATLLHPETSVVRVIGMSAAVELLLGGGSGTLANIGVLLTQLSYTRLAEEEADREALSMLEKSKISPKGLGDFFRRVETSDLSTDGQQSQQGGFMDMLGTHPPTGERIRLIERVKPYPATPVLTVTDWKALQSICNNEDR